MKTMNGNVGRARRGWVAGVPYAAGLLSPIAVTTAMVALGQRVNATEAAMVFLLLALGVAVGAGFWPAVATSILATLSFNLYFLPPLGTLTIADPANWVALFTFLATAFVTSRLVTAARQRSDEADRRAQEAMRLYEFSRSLLAVADPADVEAELLPAASHILGCTACCLCESSGDRLSARPDGVLGPAAAADLSAWLRSATDSGSIWRRTVESGVVLGLRLHQTPRGQPQALVARFGAAAAVPAETTLEALAGLASIAAERARLLAESLQSQVIRRSEAVKSALLSSVSHDLRTPLSAVRIAATALQDPALWADPPARQELLATMDEATSRLNRAVGNLLCMSRIEAGELHLDLQLHPVAEPIAAALELVGSGPGARLQVTIAAGTPPLRCDAGLLATAVANLLDNALKYSPPDAPVEVVAAAAEGQVSLSIHDHGPGVPPGQEEEAFRPFRRVAAWAGGQPSGLGLGLSIARALIEAHDGRIRLEARPGGGTTAHIRLPAEATPPEGPSASVPAQSFPLAGAARAAR